MSDPMSPLNLEQTRLSALAKKCQTLKEIAAKIVKDNADMPALALRALGWQDVLGVMAHLLREESSPTTDWGKVHVAEMSTTFEAAVKMQMQLAAEMIRAGASPTQTED